MESSEELFHSYLVALDVEEMLVGCPLLQAAMGGDSRLLSLVSVETWTMTQTENLCLYRIFSKYHEDLVVSALERRVRDARLRQVQQAR